MCFSINNKAINTRKLKKHIPLIFVIKYRKIHLTYHFLHLMNAFVTPRYRFVIMKTSKEDIKMKLKLMYVGIVILGIGSIIWFTQDFNKEVETDINQVTGEIILLSNELNETDIETPVGDLESLKQEIDDYKALIQDEVSSIKTLKESFEGDYSTLSEQEKIYLRISLLEVRKYREAYQDTIGSIEALIEPYYGAFDQISDEEIETLKTEIKTIMTYRLVLLEKAYDELITIKNILLNT